ncbi:UBX protein [Geosmithia morbida]|uniref:UBX protein n=1 Tax=Geosmithia morbida TaxID=1094350 RepID=A0A9P5CY59_9HYPO|nr:UBX protein [Geosmithia morbida]KAF4120033.1 UBX protein [Geosmithia morbida]
MPSDLESLIDMGFDKSRAEIAIKKSGGLQGALEWLEKTQDKSLEDIQNEDADEEDDEEATKAKIAELETGTAKSMVCNECGKKFRSVQAAEFHASKRFVPLQRFALGFPSLQLFILYPDRAISEHTDFSESTEEIAPLTEDEKKARLEELRERVRAKKAALSIKDKEEAKRNEQIRAKSTRETEDAKEELKRKEQIREAARKRQEKQDDIEAKKRIKAKIEADKAERRRKAEEAKAAREGRVADTSSAATVAPAAAPALAKPKADHNEARLRLQTPSGNIMKTLPAETTLFELAQQVQSETGNPVTSFTTNFPRKVFQGDVDMSKTLKEAGLTPSSVLIVT